MHPNICIFCFTADETPQAILKSADGLLSLKSDKGTASSFSDVMFATGRRPNTKNLGLEMVGVKMTRNGGIEVDEYSRTSVPSTWAVGDATDRMNLTPVALMEGMALAKTLFRNEPTKPDYRAVPTAVFSQPPIAQVGLTEGQAVQGYGDIDIFTANFRPLKATVSGLRDRVLMKLVVWLLLTLNTKHYGFAVSVKAGLTKADFDATVGIHTSSAEEIVTMRTPTQKIRSGPPENPVPFTALASIFRLMTERIPANGPKEATVFVLILLILHGMCTSLTLASIRLAISADFIPECSLVPVTVIARP
ncbi:hypothetical protein Nepgr_032682 [Nepenthes gracilis]|uniref:Uncharacterized protein n=1 Tax=Nepenthes gracilis TaxID=150966 RepID=A0AAD3Y824_NEPGR|nr:hypothetical protein Nepgr_032682 [Nepenthes gracilis]